MVPAYLDVLSAFPLLTSGKADRKRLPPPESPLASEVDRLAKPKTPLEKKIATVWEKALKIPEAGAEQDFFLDLGGHSLLAAKLVTLLRDEANIHVPVRDIYAHPTVRQLAVHVESLKPQPHKPAQANTAAKPAAKLIKPGAILVTAQITSVLVLLLVLSSPLALIIPVIEGLFWGQVRSFTP